MFTRKKRGLPDIQADKIGQGEHIVTTNDHT